jgi:hypothetical protein
MMKWPRRFAGQTAWRRFRDRLTDPVSTSVSASVGLDGKRRDPADTFAENVAYHRSAFRNVPLQDRNNGADLVIDVGVLAAPRWLAHPL